MKKSLFILAWAAIASIAWADDPLSYEANPSVLDLEGYVVFFNGTGPLSFVTAAPRVYPLGITRLGRVHVESCEQGWTLPFSLDLRTRSAEVSGGYGDGGYVKAMRKLQKENSEIKGIYDVQVDYHDTVILSIYSKHCVNITGRAFR